MEDIISTEEVRERKVVRKHTSQASGCHDVPIEESEKLSIVIHERGRSRLTDNILQKLKSLEEVSVARSPKPRIQKVPFVLRDNKDLEKYFKPRMVSIGPIHHGKFKFTEKIKHKLASEFIKKHRLDKEELYIKIEKEIENLRKCYYEEETKDYNDEDLAWMFLVDGCAVLHYIDCNAQEDRGKKLEELNIKNDQIAFAQQDLLLLENQLPYQVLELLMSSVVDRETLRKSIDKFIEDNIMRPQKQREQQQQQPQQKQQPQQQQQPQRKQQPQQQQQQQEEPTHLLHLLRKRLLQNPSEGPNFMERLHQKCKHCIGNQKGKTTHNWHTFRNVKELKAAGIRLRPSKTSFLTDISFHRMFLIATLKLPPLIVDDSTAPKFLNLMAYEMCPDFVNDFGVTSYVCFLDSLIDQAEDVKELRNKHILHNALGSDEEVATLFNKITTDLVPNPETYDNVKECIQNHWDRRWTKWIAQGYNDHFSSPWTFLAFVGALIALALSFIQAWYSMPHDDDPCDKVCCNITRIITNAST